MSIEKYSQFISLHEQKTKTIGLRSEAVQNDKGLHIHTEEGAETIHITDLPHSRDGVDSLEKKIGEHLHKKHPKHYDSAEDATDQYVYAHTEGSYDHHTLSNDKPNKKMTSDEYAASEAKNAHKHIQSMQ